ncbi:hypothetical protein [Nocardia sp. NPDC057440]|uniref:DUF7427 family protein n=1 Tax=Nocardia sp. NPDC057440 TaxID=3346134 RepID=UPI00366A6877
MIKGRTGWTLIIGLVALIDFTAKPGETLSEALFRARHKHPVLVTAAIAVTVYHFMAGDHATLSRYDSYKLFTVLRAIHHDG